MRLCGLAFCVVLGSCAMGGAKQLMAENFRVGHSIPKAQPLPGSATGERYWYANFDLLRTDPGDPDILYGNWRDSVWAACNDGAIRNFVHRTSLKTYRFITVCPGSQRGVWRFLVTAAPAG